MFDRADVMQRLEEIIDPCSAANGTNFNLVEMGMIKDVCITGGDVRVELRLTFPGCWMLEFFMTEIPKRVGTLEGVEKVAVHADGGWEWEPEMMDRGRRREYLDALRQSTPTAG